MATMVKDQDQDQEIMELQNNLAKLPLSMAKFSSMIRSLYSVNKVTGQDQGTKTFIEVRDNTRRNAAVYKDKVLPLTEEVIRHIGFFADSFTDFEYEDWSEGLDDIISDVDKAIGFCEILRQMHLSIIEDLKVNEDKAQIGIVMMERMAKQYQEMCANLNEEAKVLGDTATTKKIWGAVTGAFTLGISTAILAASASNDVEKANQKFAEALARKENADIAQRAVGITVNCLIPAVQDFIVGMEACSSFLVNNKENLEKMRNYGVKGAKEMYYKGMKKRAQGLSNNSMRFLQMTDMMRTDIAAIPAETGDKNYVDVWFDQQKVKFANENKGLWSKIANAVIGKKGLTLQSGGSVVADDTKTTKGNGPKLPIQ